MPEPVVEYSCRLIRAVAKALPPLPELPKLKKELLWRSAVLFVGPWAVATSGDVLTVALDQARNNPRSMIYFPKDVRKVFKERGRIPEVATWSEGVWSIPDRYAVTGARWLNEWLAEEGGGQGAWANWSWLDLLRSAVADPPAAADFAISGSALFRVLSANNDFNDGPVGFSPRGSSVVVTHRDPRVVTILSPWRPPVPVPEWAGGLRLPEEDE